MTHHKINYFGILTAIFCILFAGGKLFAAEKQITDNLVFLFSGNVFGEIEPCGWSSNKLGGLSGKAFQVKRSKTQSELPHLLVDSGNLLFEYGKAGLPTSIQMLTAETIQTAYKKMEYDAVAVSNNDLTAGVDFFENSRKNNFPWVSANVFDISGKLLFNPFIIKQIGDMTVGVIGLTGSGKYKNDKIVIGGWQESLSLQLEDLIPQTDMIVLLSNLPSDQNYAIAKVFPELDVIVTANKRQGNVPPSVVGDTLFTQTQGRGKYIGKLSIQYQPDRKWPDTAQETPSGSNRFKVKFIAIRPQHAQSQEINEIISDLKKKITAMKNH